MAFTNAQKVDIREALGYPSILRYKDTRLESAIDVIGDDPDAKAKAESILADIATAATATTTGLKVAGLKRAEDVEWYQAGSGTSGGSAVAAAQRSHGRMLCSRLSQLFGVPLYGDMFGEHGYPGDDFTGPAHQYGGGIIPLG